MDSHLCTDVPASPHPAPPRRARPERAFGLQLCSPGSRRAMADAARQGFPVEALDAIAARTAHLPDLRVTGPGHHDAVVRPTGKGTIPLDPEETGALVEDPETLGFVPVNHVGYTCISLLWHPTTPGMLHKIVEADKDGWWPWALACMTARPFWQSPFFLRVHAGWRLDADHVPLSMERLQSPDHLADDQFERTMRRMDAIIRGQRPSGRYTGRIETAAHRLRATFGDRLSPDIREDNIMARTNPGQKPCLVLADPYGYFR